MLKTKAMGQVSSMDASQVREGTLSALSLTSEGTADAKVDGAESKRVPAKGFDTRRR